MIINITDKKNLNIKRIIKALLSFISERNRRGITFWSTVNQTKLNKVIFLMSLINHKWKGAIPNFIIINKHLNILICVSNVNLNNNKIDPIDWNKKYLTVFLCSWNKVEVIKINKNLNMLTSILIQILMGDLLDKEISKLAKFIVNAKKNRFGEIALCYLSDRKFKFTI